MHLRTIQNNFISAIILNMENITLQEIVLIIGVLSVIFSVFLYFKNPQIKLEKNQALAEAEIDSKASTLAQQVQWEKESTERRFMEIQKDIKGAFELAFNHSNEALAGVKELTVVVNAMGKEVTRLSTIIEERIPRK